MCIFMMVSTLPKPNINIGAMMRALSLLLPFVLLVTHAEAAQWPVETCTHLQEIRTTINLIDPPPNDRRAAQLYKFYKAVQSLPLLEYLNLKCGAKLEAEAAQARRIMNAGPPASPDRARGPILRSNQPSRTAPSMDCITVPLSGGGSTTHCH